MHTIIPLFYPKIGPQLLSELRRLPWRVACELVPDRFLHYAWTAVWSAHSDFVGSRLCACLGVACHLHFWQNGRDLLRAIAVGNAGVEQTTNKSQHRKWTLEKKIPSLLLRDSNAQPYDLGSGALPTSYPDTPDWITVWLNNRLIDCPLINWFIVTPVDWLIVWLMHIFLHGWSVGWLIWSLCRRALCNIWLVFAWWVDSEWWIHWSTDSLLIDALIKWFIAWSVDLTWLSFVRHTWVTCWYIVILALHNRQY